MKTRMTRRLVPGLVLLASLVLVACSNQRQSSSQSSSTTTSTTSQTSSTASSSSTAASSTAESSSAANSQASSETSASSTTESSSATDSTPAPSTDTSYPTQDIGTYTFKHDTPVKASPQADAATEFTFAAGDSVNYAQRIIADNHIWIAYPDYNGVTHYAMIE